MTRSKNQFPWHHSNHPAMIFFGASTLKILHFAQDTMLLRPQGLPGKLFLLLIGLNFAFLINQMAISD
ncbi:MAG: hypothetical protein GY858_07360 [Candidatus Omnitrophica bacterium]|nr:hypothetical protein [Candidatus Omnitrophota bacterium]